MRARIAEALKEALEGGDPVRIGTLRLMLAALTDREIVRRGDEGPVALDEAECRALLARMIAHREASTARYEESAQMELAERERREAAIIREFLPKPLSAAETDAAIARAIVARKARSIRDLGRVMAALKADYGGRMDFVAASAKVRAALA